MSQITGRTRKWLREQGYRVDTVERWIAQLRQRSDLFGIIDLIAIKPGEIVGVQSCGTAYADHLKTLTKIRRQESIDWLRSGARLLLIGWRKVKQKRGGKQKVYKPRIKWFTMEDFYD